MPTYIVFLNREGLPPPVHVDPESFPTREEFRKAAIAAQANRTQPAFDAFDRDLKEAGLEDRIEVHLKVKATSVSVALTTDQDTIEKIMGFPSVLSVRDAGMPVLQINDLSRN